MQALSLTQDERGYIFGMQTGRPSKHPRSAFGARLHMLREQAGLSQEQLAKKLSLPQRTYAYWERAEVALRAEQLASLSQALGVSADFLLGRDEPKPRGSGPTGKMKQLFEAASQLSRNQQQKIAAILEPFVAQHSSRRNKAA